MKRRFHHFLFIIIFCSCTKTKTNAPMSHTLTFEASWMHNAYYQFKINGQVLSKSIDSFGTLLDRQPNYPYKNGDFVELTIHSLDVTGHLDNLEVHGAIILDGYKQTTNTANGSLYIYY